MVRSALWVSPGVKSRSWRARWRGVVRWWIWVRLDILAGLGIGFVRYGNFRIEEGERGFVTDASGLEGL